MFYNRHQHCSAKKSALHTELALWEMYLVGTDFLAGPGYGPTLADMSFFPNLAYMVSRCGLLRHWSSCATDFARCHHHRDVELPRSPFVTVQVLHALLHALTHRCCRSASASVCKTGTPTSSPSSNACARGRQS